MDDFNGLRTVEVKNNAESMIKPGELVDIIEMSPLTLMDRRIFNLLLANAWDNIEEKKEHVIAKSELSGSHKGNERIGESIERLMAAIVKVQIEDDGQKAYQRIQLLGPNTEHEQADGLLRYHFPEQLLEIIGESHIFARLHRKVILNLSSKYALALYEMIQKRGNLTHKQHEDFEVDDLKSLLGVPIGKLKTWTNFRMKALDVALKEVNGLSGFRVFAQPKKQGRKVVSIRLSWYPKEPDLLEKTEKELGNVKFGRNARLSGTVENPAPLPRPSGMAIENFRQKFGTQGGRTQQTIEEWQDSLEDKKWQIGKDLDQSFLAFATKKYAAKKIA